VYHKKLKCRKIFKLYSSQCFWSRWIQRKLIFLFFQRPVPADELTFKVQLGEYDYENRRPNQVGLFDSSEPITVQVFKDYFLNTNAHRNKLTLVAMGSWSFNLEIFDQLLMEDVINLLCLAIIFFILSIKSFKVSRILKFRLTRT